MLGAQKTAELPGLVEESGGALGGEAESEAEFGVWARYLGHEVRHIIAEVALGAAAGAADGGTSSSG